MDTTAIAGADPLRAAASPLTAGQRNPAKPGFRNPTAPSGVVALRTPPGGRRAALFRIGRGLGGCPLVSIGG
jgi:hypothetical protein